MKLIKEYKENEEVQISLLITEASIQSGANGKYISLTFQDQSGTIKGNIWSPTEDQLTNYKAGVVVKIQGSLKTFRNSLQLNIKTATIDTSREPQSFYKASPVPLDEMLTTLKYFVAKIENEKLSTLTKHILRKHHEAIKVCPAARSVHHEYVGGLLHHTITMLKLAESIINLYDGINASLLYSAIINHDIAKIFEFESCTPGSKYSLKGNLLGHISMMVAEIAIVAKELNIDGEEVTLLQHLILSHHGKPEWGSAIPPKTKEAIILHQIDIMDAYINMATKAEVGVEQGEYTERIFGFDNRQLYVSKI